MYINSPNVLHFTSLAKSADVTIWAISSLFLAASPQWGHSGDHTLGKNLEMPLSYTAFLAFTFIETTNLIFP